jgi:hypothetical protein
LQARALIMDDGPAHNMGSDHAKKRIFNRSAVIWSGKEDPQPISGSLPATPEIRALRRANRDDR